uniref:Uncharacterized protein n=1 Tax=Strigamia maritima TaxID=126957 RepID=T1INH7_STRMM
MKAECEKLKRAGVIEDSNSSYSAPVLLVFADGKDPRLVTDFRQFLLPIIQELLDKVSPSKYFTTMYLTSSFYQIKVAKHCRHITSFSTSFA